MAQKITIGIIGFGYWGPNLCRNFISHSQCQVKTIVDVDQSRLSLAKKLYPYLHTSQNVREVLVDPEIQAVVIATPVHLHYEIVKSALIAGKHVLVEKPMTYTVKLAEELLTLANKEKRILMVDHTFLYTGAVKKIKEIIAGGQAGKVQYFDSTRINLGLFQHDVNVLWDLAVHDVSILDFLIGEEPVSVVATGISHTEKNIENIAFLTLYFQSNIIAHLNCSWISPMKIRRVLIGGTEKMIVYDDIEPTEKVKIYDYGYKVAGKEMLVDYRFGDIVIPKLDTTEALWGVASDFITAIQTGKNPLSDACMGARVVRILEAANTSLRNKGEEVFL